MRDLSRLHPAGTILDNEGEPVGLLLPEPSYVDYIAALLMDKIYPFDECLPPNGTDRWNADNLALVTTMLSGRVRDVRGNLLPHYAARINAISPHALLWLLESYLACVVVDGVPLAFEQVGCNGSSVIPDVWEFGYFLKDPASVPHDLEWARHHAGDIPDCRGHAPDFHRSNRYYRDVLRGLGHDKLAAERFMGLELLGRVRWC